MTEIIAVAHNIRSSYNIGSIFRTCDGLGIKKLILTGHSPYPLASDDKRLPHVAKKASLAIHKTALGAEKYLDWEYSDSILTVISNLKSQGYTIASLELSPSSIKLNQYVPPQKIAVILGNEVDGVDKKILQESDVIIEIEMKGKKESLNVSVAAAICLYSLSISK